MFFLILARTALVGGCVIGVLYTLGMIIIQGKLLWIHKHLKSTRPPEWHQATTLLYSTYGGKTRTKARLLILSVIALILTIVGIFIYRI